MKKRLGKKWGKIKLLETSAVGIPMYPNAVNKAFRSLIKALGETEEIKGKLNLEKSPMEDGETETPTEEAEEVTEEVVEEAPESEVSETEEAEEAPEEVEKGLSKKDMMDIMTKGFQAAIKASATPRGLIDNESQVEKMEEVLAKKSIGELAIMNGMFKAPDIYGRVI